MKKILILSILFISVQTYSQRFEIVELEKGKYSLQKDTIEGVINYHYTPVENVNDYLITQISSIDSQIALELKINEASNAKLKELYYQLDVLNKLKESEGLKKQHVKKPIRKPVVNKKK